MLSHLYMLRGVYGGQIYRTSSSGLSFSLAHSPLSSSSTSTISMGQIFSKAISLFISQFSIAVEIFAQKCVCVCVCVCALVSKCHLPLDIDSLICALCHIHDCLLWRSEIFYWYYFYALCTLYCIKYTYCLHFIQNQCLKILINYVFLHLENI